MCAYCIIKLRHFTLLKYTIWPLDVRIKSTLLKCMSTLFDLEKDIIQLLIYFTVNPCYVKQKEK